MHPTTNARTRGRVLALLLTALLVPAGAGAFDFKKLFEGVQGTGAAATLTDPEIAQGLKQALSQGVQRAVESLGRPDGFLGSSQVRIPMPDSLARVESTLRALRQDAYADQFIETMNRAAEEAVPEAASIFGDAIGRMSLDDARGILNGADDAATEYFRRTSTEQLVTRFHPIVARATDAAGVTASYKELVGRAGVAGQLLGRESTDLDGYVTSKAVDGLFTVIAQEEKRIRAEPIARTTELLKKVFR